MGNSMRWPLSLALVAIIGLGACGDDDDFAGDVTGGDFCVTMTEAVTGPQFDGIDVVVFLDPGTTEDEAQDLRDELEADDNVQFVEWVDQEEAYAEVQRRFADMDQWLDSIDEESVSPSLQVRLEDPTVELGVDLENRPGVDQVLAQPDFATERAIDQLVRPLTDDPDLVTRYALTPTAGVVELGLGTVAPEEIADEVETIEVYWRDPALVEDPDSVTDAARAVAAYFDDNCA